MWTPPHTLTRRSVWAFYALQVREIVARLDDFAVRVRSGPDALSWSDRRQIVRMLVAKRQRTRLEGRPACELSIAFTT
jgi:hypothetical protein